METLLFGPSDIHEYIDMQNAIDAIREAFKAYHDGRAVMPPKSYIDLPQYNGDFRAMPAYVDGAAGLKWVNSHPDNPERHGLPAVMGVMIYSDPETAYPLAVMDGTTLTRYRTGAVAGLATDLLANPDSSSIGLIGAGVQAYTQLEAVSLVRDLGRVVVYDIDEDATQRFIESMDDRDFDLIEGSAEEAAGCDIVCTTTPSRDPIVKSEWVKPGTHINAMGADASGKQELESDLVLEALVVLDDTEQCMHSGEVNIPVSNGLFDEGDVFAEFAEVVVGEKKRASSNDITIFDSTGLAIQDVATARLVYESGRGDGMSFGLVDES